MLKRPRRNRKSAAIRSLVEETILRPADLVVPFFLIAGENQREQIPSMPLVERLSIDLIVKQAEKLHASGIQAVALFPVIKGEEKDPIGSIALQSDNLVARAIQTLKKQIPSLCVITDIALDPYTSHGHDGILNSSGEVANDATIEVLSQMALMHAQAGADIVAPSDMMDGRVGAIRRVLDGKSFHDVNILSYTAKYASSLYAPFRDALGSQLRSGDKKTYQMNPSNAREALLEAALDVEEGADILMVKPALYYLDIIAKLKEHTHVPIAAYHVSGEYAMVMAAHEKGYGDAEKMFYEALLSIKRAGADFIFSYAAPMILKTLC
ncbi:MAG: porphobilinogen synthase [Rhabdochlamydiaceae bacterium]|nr:porphobilinogen synthase [Rhabdochlamydiaceae bacterium]